MTTKYKCTFQPLSYEIVIINFPTMNQAVRMLGIPYAPGSNPGWNHLHFI